MLNKEKFVGLLTGLCEMFNQKPSEFIFTMYYNIFKDHSLEQFTMAVLACVKNHKYNTLPKPAEILEFLEGSREDKALFAWVQVMEGIKKAGYYNTIEFKDSTISHCIDNLGGWMWLCSQDKSQLPFIEKRFLDLYNIFTKRGADSPILLIGYFDSVNCKNGYNASKVIKIGFGVIKSGQPKKINRRDA